MKRVRWVFVSSATLASVQAACSDGTHVVVSMGIPVVKVKTTDREAECDVQMINRVESILKSRRIDDLNFSIAAGLCQH